MEMDRENMSPWIRRNGRGRLPELGADYKKYITAQLSVEDIDRDHKEWRLTGKEPTIQMGQ